MNHFLTTQEIESNQPLLSSEDAFNYGNMCKYDNIFSKDLLGEMQM